MGSINYMLFQTGFEGYANLTYVRFTTRGRNLVTSLSKHRVRFIFSNSKKLFEGFVGFEHSFDILLSQNLEI